jgi:hypothetical protein
MISIVPGLIVYIHFFRRLLDPFHADWLFASTPATADAATSGLGWLYFSEDRLRWPLGSNPHYGGEIANSLLFSDSLPSFALPLRLLFGWAIDGRATQFAGLGLLVCLTVQSSIAYFLLRRWTSVQGAAFVGAFFFVTLPAFLGKWNISSLMWQWLVLAGLLVMSSQMGIRRRGATWMGLTFFSTGISLYYSAMLLTLGGCDLLLRPRQEPIGRVFVAVLGLVSMVPLGLWMWGAFSIPLRGAAAPEVLGTYAANGLALADPGTGSALLSDLPGGTGEGFAYLGLGVALLLISGIGVLVSRPDSLNDCLYRVRNYLAIRPAVVPIAVSSALLALLSMLPYLSVGGNTLTVPLPGPVAGLLSVFRANGRFLWPLMYVAVLVALVLGARVLRRRGSLLLLLALTVQILDTRPVWSWAGQSVDEAASATTLYTGELSSILSLPGVAAVEVVPAYPYPPDAPWREIGYAAHSAGLPLGTIGYFNRYDPARLRSIVDSGLESVRARDLRDDTIYIVSQDVYSETLADWPGARDLMVLDGWHVLRTTGG